MALQLQQVTNAISLNGRAATRRPIRTLFLVYFWNVANKMILRTVHLIEKSSRPSVVFRYFLNIVCTWSVRINPKKFEISTFLAL